MSVSIHRTARSPQRGVSSIAVGGRPPPRPITCGAPLGVQSWLRGSTVRPRAPVPAPFHLLDSSLAFFPQESLRWVFGGARDPRGCRPLEVMPEGTGTRNPGDQRPWGGSEPHQRGVLRTLLGVGTLRTLPGSPGHPQAFWPVLSPGNYRWGRVAVPLVGDMRTQGQLEGAGTRWGPLRHQPHCKNCICETQSQRFGSHCTRTPNPICE